MLHGDLRDPGEGLAVLGEGSGVANHKNFGISVHGEIILDANPAGAIGIDSQPLAGGRWQNAGRPDDSFAGDAFSGDNDTLGIDQVDAMAQAQFDADPLEARLGFCRELRRKSTENMIYHVHKDDSCG